MTSLVAFLSALMVVSQTVADDPRCSVGVRVVFVSRNSDTRVFVWDSVAQLGAWRDHTWTARDVIAHSIYVRVGTQAITVGGGHTTVSACPGYEAVAVRVLEQPYRNRYGYVDAADVRIEH